MKLGLAVGLLLMMTLAPTMSATAEPEAAEPTAGQADEQDNGKTPTTPSPSPDIFIPTEEISEDFAVPFPVDI